MNAPMNPELLHPAAPTTEPGVNFAYLDERTKRMIRRAILKAVAIPGYQCPSARARCRCPTAGARAASRSRPR